MIVAKHQWSLKYVANNHVSEEFNGELVYISRIAFMFHVQILVNINLVFSFGAPVCKCETAELGFGLSCTLTYCWW